MIAFFSHINQQGANVSCFTNIIASGTVRAKYWYCMNWCDNIAITQWTFTQFWTDIDQLHQIPWSAHCRCLILHSCTVFRFRSYHSLFLRFPTHDLIFVSCYFYDKNTVVCSELCFIILQWLPQHRARRLQYFNKEQTFKLRKWPNVSSVFLKTYLKVNCPLFYYWSLLDSGFLCGE